MIRHESAVEVCVRFAPELGAAVWRDRPNGGFRWRGEVAGLVINVMTREMEEQIDPELPRAVRKLRESFCEVYKAAVGMCRELGPATRLMPQQVVDAMNAGFRAAQIKRYASLHTVGHAFQALEEVGAVKGAAGLGWIVVMFPPARQEQLDFGDGSLPSEERQTRKACSVAEISQTSRVARDSRERYTERAATMFGKRIWVPGEKDEFQTGGLVVTDTDGATHLLEGKQSKVRYAGRSGRVATPLAVRCELVCVTDEGRYQVATVKAHTPEGRKQIRVRVLGDWQLEGRTSDREEAAELAANN